MNNLRVIVAGNRGFIGSAVTRTLRSMGGVTVIGVDRDRTKGRDPAVDQQIFAPIDPELLDSLRGFHPHVIVNMAGEPDVGKCQAFPDDSWLSNVYATEVLIRMAQLFETPRIVHASSAAIYGRDTQSVYARDKMLAEYLVITAPNIFQRINLRFFNVYGPGADHGVISHWSRAVARGERPRIDADPDTVRDFIHVDDVAMAVVHAATFAMAEGAAFTVDVCTGHGTTLRQLSGMMGISPDSMVQPPPDQSVIPISIGDPTKAEQMLRFRARRKLSEEIASTIASHRDRL